MRIETLIEARGEIDSKVNSNNYRWSEVSKYNRDLSDKWLQLNDKISYLWNNNCQSIFYQANDKYAKN